ncbi:MAG: PBP1A family penicillin-binding protein [Spirochaetota bacterium]
MKQIDYNKVNFIYRMYRFFVTPFVGGRFELLKLLLLAGFLSALWIFVFAAKPEDFAKVLTAKSYQRPSIVYGVNQKGEYEKIAEFYKFSRIILSVAELKKEKGLADTKNRVVQCFLSTEDNNFFSHFGVDIRGIIRAMAVNIVAGRIKEGASTITQQVSRLKFLSNERSYMRKVREAWYALLMEWHYPKDTILEMYLNEIPLGHGALGAGAAAKFYFDKTIDELSWGEAALLSSLTTRPSQFSPIVNPNLSSRKVRVIFMKLIETGRLNVKQAVSEYKAFIPFYRKLNRSPNDSAFSIRLNRFPYFTEYIRRQLVKDKKLGDIYSSGYNVYTSLQIEHQKAAEKVMAKGLQKQTKVSGRRKFTNTSIFDKSYGSSYDVISQISDLPEFKFKVYRAAKTFKQAYEKDLRDKFTLLNYLSGSAKVAQASEKNYLNHASDNTVTQVEGALISMRPETGHITAMVGGSGFRSDNQQLRPIQAYRQPGSSFKPLVYAAAIDYSAKHPKFPDKITASSLFLDSPLSYLSADGAEWNPSNYSEQYEGFMRLRSALASSRNMVALRVMDQIKPWRIKDTLHDMLGLKDRKKIPENISIALGTFEVAPIDIAKAYAMFASKGKEVHPISILYITDTKEEMLIDYRIEHDKKERKQIISAEASYIITSMMRSVVNNGTGGAVRRSGLSHPAAGKTGTTNNFRDAWFVGFTPSLVTAIWLGYDLGTLSLGRGMAGGTISAPLWGKYMKLALKNEKRKKFPGPKGLHIVTKRVCSLSGMSATSKCRKTYEEVFIKGTTPKPCDHHGSFPSFPTSDDFSPQGLEESPRNDSKKPEDDFERQPVKEPKKPNNSPTKKPNNFFKGDETID